jgi:hypothetical protein
MGPPQDALFKFEVPWATADREGIADKKMRPWVQKKLIEFLGEDEPALTGAAPQSVGEHHFLGPHGVSIPLDLRE